MSEKSIMVIVGNDSFGGSRMAVTLELMRRFPDLHVVDITDRLESEDDRLRGLIESFPAVQAVEDSEEGPGYGPPLPPASERLKRKAQWKQETAWSRRK